jgi:hypothetical protein
MRSSILLSRNIDCLLWTGLIWEVVIIRVILADVSMVKSHTSQGNTLVGSEDTRDEGLILLSTYCPLLGKMGGDRAARVRGWRWLGWSGLGMTGQGWVRLRLGCPVLCWPGLGRLAWVVGWLGLGCAGLGWAELPGVGCVRLNLLDWCVLGGMDWLGSSKLGGIGLGWGG